MNKHISTITFSKDDIKNEENLYGKCPNIMEMEKLFDSISEYDESEKKKMVNPSKIGSISERLEKLICKEFNFQDIAIDWYNLQFFYGPTGPCTVPVYPNYFALINGTYDYEVTKNSNGGYKWKESKGKVAYIYVGTQGLCKFTSKEYMALLLHEVGHSFNKCTSTWQKIAHTAFAPMSCIQKYLFKFFSDSTRNNLKKDPKLANSTRKVNEGMERFWGFLADGLKIMSASTILMNITGMLTNLITYVVRFLANPANLVLYAKQYKDELESDEFARIYGYSAGLASAMAKVRKFTGKAIIKKRNTFSDLIVKMANFTSVLLILIDVHPSEYSRIKNSESYIERELKDCKNPKMKRWLKQQREEIFKVVEAYHKETEFKPFTKLRSFGDRIKEFLFWLKPDKVGMKTGSSVKN